MARSRSQLPWILVGLIGIAGLVFGLILLLDSSDGPVDPGPTAPPSRGAVDAPPAIELPDSGDLPPVGDPVDPEQFIAKGSLKGRLVNAQMQVVGGGTVSAFTGQPMGFVGGSDLKSLRLSTEVNRAGEFELHDVPAGDNIVLVANGALFAHTEAGPFLLDGGEVLDVGNLEVRPGLSVVGFVVDSNARPIEGAQVSYDGTGRTSLEHSSSIQKPSQVALTDAEGRFELLHMPETGYELIASAKGFANQVVRSDIYEPMITSLLEHRIWMQRATPLKGTVYARESGKGVAGLDVTAQPTGPTRGHEITRTDENGDFEFEALVLGDYNIIAEGPGRMRDEVHVRKADFGKSDVEIWLFPSGNLRGVVQGPEGESVKLFEIGVRFSSGKGVLKSAPIANDRVRDGEFRFDDMRPGYYSFDVWAPGYAPLQSEPQELKPGVTLGVQIKLKRAATLRGRVVDERERPIRGAKVSLHTNGINTIEWLRKDDSNAVYYKSTSTDENGLFELDDIMARKYQVEIDHPDYSLLRRNDVKAREGRVVEVPDFVLETPGRIMGVITSPNGSPVSGAMVNCGGRDLRDEPVVGLSTRTNSKGQYSFRRLPPGWYRLQAWKPAPRGTFPNPSQLLLDEAQSAYEFMQNPEDNRVDVAPGETRVKNMVAAIH
ncbi:MAG: hypothetical protein DHS20C15_10390 [Planctomycetota bacterium]|nr:MAG: hypothetical protein DHS20C15_10390 [Planctomycetota bacterium]